MNTQLTVSIDSPCGEKWSSFTQTATGGFCSSCQKTVIDFTRMTDDEIFMYFKSRPINTCGRFRPGQLRQYQAMPIAKIQPGLTLLRAGMVSLLLLLSRQAEAGSESVQLKPVLVEQVEINATEADTLSKQTPVVTGVIRGIVKDEYGDPLPGVNVILKGSSIGTATDANGAYELKAEFKEGDILLFTFIGFKMEEYQIPNSFTGALNMVMITMDMDIMGTVMVDGPYEPEATGIRKWWKKLTGWF